jgi:hypothetical protein
MNKPSTPDKRMIQLMEWAVRNNIAPTESEYLEKIGFTRTNLSNIKKGIQGFTRDHIRNACILTGASADWILDITETMFRKAPASSPVQTLRQAVAEIEQQLGFKAGLLSKSGQNKKVNTAGKKISKSVSKKTKTRSR